MTAAPDHSMLGYRAVAGRGLLATEIHETEEAAMRAAMVVQTMVHAPHASLEIAHAFAASRTPEQLRLCWAVLTLKGWRVNEVLQ